MRSRPRSTARSRRQLASPAFAAAVLGLGTFAWLSALTARAQSDPFGARASVTAEEEAEAVAARSSSVVTRSQMDARIPVSAPDALRYVPGVSIQQTAHGQASPYVRGMTGQQVVHLFDGVRMNNGIYRQGPNQYFFSVDASTLQSLSVVRGSASVHHGEDALGGAIVAHPRDPLLGPDGGLSLRPRLLGRYGSADEEAFARAEATMQLDADTGVLFGVGHRGVGRLESAGPLPVRQEYAPLVPRFESDGRTQLGTGFDETTFDGRLVRRVGRLRLVTAAYGYRQSDAPRTDQCPPPEAPVSECLLVKLQNRTLVYTALRGNPGRYIRDLDLNVSYQRHDERRLRDRPRSFVQHRYDNRIDTLGAAVSAHTAPLPAGPLGSLRVDYGAQAYRDVVRSSADQRLTDLALTVPASRGQYLDGARYMSLGAFTELSLRPWSWLVLRGGGRATVIGARAAGDPESGSASLSRNWPALVARAGIGWQPLPGVQLDLNVDQGLRAPNLDDLTSRQQVGPGYQFENALLRPERSTTYELGVRLGGDRLRLDAWSFATLIDDAITRAVRQASDCPPGRDACAASRTQFQLVNAAGRGRILGAEGGVTARLPRHVSARATVAYAWGQAPLPGQDADVRMFPISRIPPLSGTVEMGYRHLPTSLRCGAALRWAAAQERLAPSDRADARIPVGGTPGYAVVELRAGYRPAPQYGLSLVLDNLLDMPYRVHGSSINGAGRSLRIAADAGF